MATPMPASPAEAKFHLVLADRLKKSARAATGDLPEVLSRFRAHVADERARLADLPASDIDLIIGGKDAARLRRYNAAVWTREEVSLESCFVVDGMGGKLWVRGMRVPDAGALFLKREGERSRVWGMKSRTQMFLDALPIIVMVSDTERKIDDGAHRAVAAWLAGHRQMTAFVARGASTLTGVTFPGGIAMAKGNHSQGKDKKKKKAAGIKKGASTPKPPKR